MAKKARVDSFGVRLRELRKQHGLTQRELSEQAGVDFTYLSKIENDRLPYSPSIKTLQSLARVLAVDELTLMEWANKMPPVLEQFAGNAAAMRFLRRAADVARSDADWQKLTQMLETGRNKKS